MFCLTFFSVSFTLLSVECNRCLSVCDAADKKTLLLPLCRLEHRGYHVPIFFKCPLHLGRNGQQHSRSRSRGLTGDEFIICWHFSLHELSFMQTGSSQTTVSHNTRNKHTHMGKSHIYMSIWTLKWHTDLISHAFCFTYVNITTNRQNQILPSQALFGGGGVVLSVPHWSCCWSASLRKYSNTEITNYAWRQNISLGK